MRIPAPSSDMLLARRVPETRNHSSLIKSSVPGCWNHISPESKRNSASQNPTWLKLSWLFLKSDIFFADFRGSVCPVKKFQNPTVDVPIQPLTSTYRSYPKEPAYNGCLCGNEHSLWSCSTSKRNLPFFQAHGHDRLRRGEVLDGGQPPPAKRTCRSPTWG